MQFKIQGEGHTVGCLLRNRLFENGATFAACLVKHPQDEFLSINVQAENPKECILDAIHSAEYEIQSMLKLL